MDVKVRYLAASFFPLSLSILLIVSHCLLYLLTDLIYFFCKQKRLPDDLNRLVQMDIRTGAVLRTVVLGSSSHLYASYVLTEAEAAVWHRAWSAEENSKADHEIDMMKQRLMFLAEVRDALAHSLAHNDALSLFLFI